MSARSIPISTRRPISVLSLVSFSATTLIRTETALLNPQSKLWTRAEQNHLPTTRVKTEQTRPLTAFARSAIPIPAFGQTTVLWRIIIPAGTAPINAIPIPTVSNTVETSTNASSATATTPAPITMPTWQPPIQLAAWSARAQAPTRAIQPIRRQIPTTFSGRAFTVIPATISPTSPLSSLAPTAMPTASTTSQRPMSVIHATVPEAPMTVLMTPQSVPRLTGSMESILEAPFNPVRRNGAPPVMMKILLLSRP